MKRLSLVAGLTFFLATGGASPRSIAGVESILGKWLAKAETPNGPVEIDFDLKQEGSQLVGSAAMFQATMPMSALKWEEPTLSVELAVGGMNFKLVGTLKEGKFTGTWEQIGGDMKGPWSAERKPAAALTVAAPAPGPVLAGAWAAVAGTPQGDLAFTMDVKQDGEKVAGTLSSDMGSVAMQSGAFKDGKLQFEIDMGGSVYRVEGALSGDKLSGKWGPSGGGEGGPFTATRKTAPAPAPAADTASAAGVWSCVASSPDGNLPFELLVKLTDNALSGTITTPDGSVSIQKATFADRKLTFEVDYQGGTYRIEASLEAGKLKGRWAAVAGTESGEFSAERKKP